MFGLVVFIIYFVEKEILINLNYIFILIGFLYIIFGNYFQIIKVNYFIGIRIFWMFENEMVWKEIYKLGGKMWFVGGIVVILCSLILSKGMNFILFLIIIGIIIIILFVYFYLKFKSLIKEQFYLSDVEWLMLVFY